MANSLLIITLLVWLPLIPLRLILQGGVGLWRKIGDLSYLLFFLYWAALNLLILSRRDALLELRFQTFPLADTLGILLIILSLLFGYWAARTLGLVTLSTRPQITPSKAKASLIVSGPYCRLRHPFYFAEWFFLAGAALVTRSWLVLGLLAAALLIDPIVTVFEEKELVQRFGAAYREYQKKVPRLLPTRF
jgi:protein-S-isoprenylcysteine O-methyltransferase Ste14